MSENQYGFKQDRSTADAVRRIAHWEAGVEASLKKLIGSYFSDMKLIVDHGVQHETLRITSDVPQGSMLESMLWNVAFDGCYGWKCQRE